MPIHAIERIQDGGGEEIGIRLVGVGRGGILEVLYADIPGNSWNVNRIEKFTERAQDLIDFRIPLTDPSLVDDPDALTDPGRPGFFHDSGDLVARSVIISDVTFDGSRLQFTLTRAD